MLRWILIDVQYSQKAVFSFGKGLNRQNHSSSGSLVNFPTSPLSHKISDSPPVGPSIDWALQFLKNETKTFLVLQNIFYIFLKVSTVE